MIDAGLLGHWLGGVLMGMGTGLGVALLIMFLNRKKTRQLLDKMAATEDKIRQDAAEAQIDLKVELAKYKRMVAEAAIKEKLESKLAEAKDKISDLVKRD
jgi:hypothetical protein